MSQQYPPQSPPAGQDGLNQAAPQGEYADYETQAPPGVPPAPAPGPAPGARKKRAYAGQAYEFGAGANSGLGGQQQGGAAPPAPGYGGFSGQQDAAGYPQGGYQQTPAAVQQGATPMYGHQESPALGGYQAPAQGYPTPAQPGQPNVAGMTQQFGQMDMSKQPQAAPARAPVLNQLYPTDLSNQPFNVAELDFPPPPAVLPPNVSRNIYTKSIC